MAEFIKQSWLFPVIQSVHIIGLTMLVGTICLVDLRLLGIGMRRQDVGELASGLAPFTIGGLLTVALTGPLMFGSDLGRYIHNPAFVVKMALFALAVAGHFTFHRRVLSDSATLSPSGQKAVAFLSLMLWSSIVLAGRAIADFDTRAY